MSGIMGPKFLLLCLLNKQSSDLRLILPVDHVPGIPNRREQFLQERGVVTV